jgi:hypothetical protein
VLIRNAVLERIATGEIDTLFRRQVRPTVRSGGTLRTAIGMLDIVDVTPVEVGDITADDARRAGFDSADDVVAMLTEKAEGTDYMVRVRPGGIDPRVTLRDDDQLSDDDLAAITARLDRLDARSTHGPWTGTTLRLIAERPHVRAPDLAASVGRETAPFKEDVRKLKAMGLTISHSPGYELSARGVAVLRHLDAPG